MHKEQSLVWSLGNFSRHKDNALNNWGAVYVHLKNIITEAVLKSIHFKAKSNDNVTFTHKYLNQNIT